MIGELSLLYTWPGSDPGKPPIILLAHQDVVPVPTDWAAEGWEHAPFDGVIADGRGARLMPSGVLFGDREGLAAELQAGSGGLS